jgi:hypothetical protein
MAFNFSMVSNTNNMAFRSGAGSQYPLILNTGNPKVVSGYVQKSTVMKGDVLISVGSVDKWLHVTDINGVSCDGFVAQISGGWQYCELTPITTDPGAKQEITSVLITPKYSDGTSGATEEYFPVLI